MSNTESTVLKSKIQEHYDLVTPYYNSFWGKHIHHGYWLTGKETKEEAQENLVRKLIEEGEIKQNSSILDVGCGVGASSVYLAKNLKAKVTGITISSVQAGIAEMSAKESGVDAEFLVMDAEEMRFSQKFDYIWSVEAISHFPNKDKFFRDAASLLEKGGRFMLIDWFIKDGLTQEDDLKYIDPIRKGMLVPDISTMDRYTKLLDKNGLKVLKTGDISGHTAKTWDISLDIIKNPQFWALAVKNGGQFVEFLESFRAMRNGFASKNFIYGFIVAEKTI